MFRVLKSSAFRNLWVGGMISTVGDMALLIALPYHVYNLTRSMLATGGTFIAQVLPRLVLGSMAGVFVDRWDRKMIACDIARAVVPSSAAYCPEARVGLAGLRRGPSRIDTVAILRSRIRSFAPTGGRA